MTSIVSIKSPADFPGVVAGVLGFIPADSLVILGIGGGPTARVDLGLSPRDSVEPMESAFQHWTRVVVLTYTDDDTERVSKYAASVLRSHGIDVVATGRVDTSNRVHSGGNVFLAADVPAEFAERRITEARDDYLAEAAKITDADAALALAEEFWSKGNGALAWIFADRYAEISGIRATDLEARLTDAVDPRA